MKKVLLGLLALSSLAFAKEAVPAPIVVAEPVVQAYVAPMPSPYLTLRVGGDIDPRYDRAESSSQLAGLNLNDKNGKGFGFEVAAEYMYPVHQLPGLELGLGLAFQRHAKLNSVNNDFIIGNNVLNIEREIPSFDSIPLYVVSKYKFDNWDMWGTGAKLYLKGDLGWSYNIEKGDTQFRVNQNNFDLDSDIKNGLYWGAGFGVEYDNWTADLMYKVNTAKIKGEYKGYNENFSESLDYSRITLSLGYKF